MPVLVNRSIRSVTTDAFPAEIALNRSPLGTMASRCSHGLYRGVKWVSTSKCLGTCIRTQPISSLRMSLGQRSQALKTPRPRATFFLRITFDARLWPSALFSTLAIGSEAGIENT